MMGFCVHFSLFMQIVSKIDKVSVENIEQAHKLGTSIHPILEEKVDKSEFHRFQASILRDIASEKEKGRDITGAAAKYEMRIRV
jgi:hypothetical protein